MNPAHVHQYATSLPRRSKTDPLDAHVLRQCAIERQPPACPPSPDVDHACVAAATGCPRCPPGNAAIGTQSRPRVDPMAGADCQCERASGGGDRGYGGPDRDAGTRHSGRLAAAFIGRVSAVIAIHHQHGATHDRLGAGPSMKCLGLPNSRSRSCLCRGQLDLIRLRLRFSRRYPSCPPCFASLPRTELACAPCTYTC